MPSPTFRTCCLAGSALAAVLAVVLVAVPGLVFWLFEIDAGDSAAFLGRRAAMLFLGLAVTLWAGRDALPSTGRQAIALGTGATFLALALLGGAELARGAAGPGILVAILIETLLGGAFLLRWREDAE